MSIRWKLILGSLSFLAIIVAVYVATSMVTRSQKADGRVINLAGRQRALSQAMGADLLSYARNPTPESWKNLANTTALFEATQNALLDGGEAPSTMQTTGPTVTLPAATDSLVREQLGSAALSFTNFQGVASQVKQEALDAREAGDGVVRQVPQVIHRIEAVVARIQRITEDENLDADARIEWGALLSYASRQAMLTQQLGTLALSYLRRPTPELKEEIDGVIDVFESTQEALMHGGRVIRDIHDTAETEMIASAPDARVQSLLVGVSEQWLQFTAALRTLKSAAVDNRQHMLEARAITPGIFSAMNEVVLRSQQLSELKVAAVEKAQIVGVILGLLLLIFSGLMGNRLGRNVAGAVQAAQTIADGDLTHRSNWKAGDETGRLQGSFNEMATRLSELVRQVQESGVNVSSSSTQIAASSRQQEAAISELAASATEIAATSTEIAATAEELLATMNDVNQVHHKAQDAAVGSQGGLDEMKMTMAAMVESTRVITDRLSAISEKTAKISTVVTTIMKIAQQTNLISLNAAIEAENAGELGLGFAVVAKEVRRLADQTAKASAGIEQMVKEMQSAVSTAVMSMDGFSDDIRQGANSVNLAATSLEELIEVTRALGPRFDSVREGMTAQAEGANQIAEGVRQIVESSEQAAESVRQTNNAIGTLTESAGELRAGVSRFKIAENGAAPR
jgi:methyl-accepting chemotaxis protein